MSKTVLFDLVFLTPRQKVTFGPRTQNDDFLGLLLRARALLLSPLTYTTLLPTNPPVNSIGQNNYLITLTPTSRIRNILSPQ